MKPRINSYQAAPGVMKAMLALENEVAAERARPVAARAGQDPRLADQRLRLLPAHAHPRRPRDGRDRAAALPARRLARIAALFSERERAALAWTEAVTLVSETTFPTTSTSRRAAHFTEEELAKLTLLIVAINGWSNTSPPRRLVRFVLLGQPGADAAGHLRQVVAVPPRRRPQGRRSCRGRPPETAAASRRWRPARST